MIQTLCRALLFFLAIMVPGPGGATVTGDDVLATIQQAVRQYEQGDYAGAASNLEYAAQLVRQKKSEKLKQVLPPPLAGWEAGPATAQAVGTAVFGGGVTVSRTYTRDSSLVTVEIVSDSPVLQSVMMMLNNPMFAGASGGVLQMIHGHQAIVKYSEADHGGDISMVIGNQLMVTVRGERVGLQDLLAYAGAVDFTALDRY